MEIELTVTKKFDVKYLLASCGVRYWEDATVNQEEDENGLLIPCRNGEKWCPLIDLETGQILNWDQGTKAEIHYKVCDDGAYSLVDENKNVVKTIEGYVPNIMSPGEDGHGDYVIMDVDENGFIQNWQPQLSEFQGDY